MTKAENLYSECVDGIIGDIKRVRRKKMEICDLLKKYRDTSERDFIQKYAETEIAVGSFELTNLSYIFALFALVLVVVIPNMPATNSEAFKSSFYYIGVIFVISLFGYLVWSIFEKNTLKYIIYAIEADKLISQKTENPEPKPIIDVKKDETKHNWGELLTVVIIYLTFYTILKDALVNKLSLLEKFEIPFFAAVATLIILILIYRFYFKH